MAMKRYNQNNLERTKLLELLSVKSKKTRDFKHIQQYAHQIWIINGSMFIRQQIALHLFSNSSSRDWQCLSFWICPHLEFVTHGDYAHVRPLSAPYDRWLTRLHFYDKMDIEAYHTSFGLKQCCHCRTEYRIDFEHYPGHGMVVFCTQWKDLGAGPDHRSWKTHISYQLLLSQSVWLNVGELFSAFQQGNGLVLILLCRLGLWTGCLRRLPGRR
jgi:hypothetical protein